MKTRKIVLCMIMTIACLFATKTTNAQMKFGPKLGLNLANVSMSPVIFAPSMKIGWHAGGILDYGFTDALSLQVEALISTKGFSMDLGVFGKSYLAPMYFELPIGIAYKYAMGSMKIYGVAGPYIGYGFGGKEHSEITGQPAEDEDIEWGSADTTANPMDFGLKVGAGVEISNIIVGVNYGIGMANMVNGGQGGSIKNMVIGITAGYLFGGKE